MQCPDIKEVRYNTGISDFKSTRELLETLSVIRATFNKNIWLDLKGRQLRITKWADPLYEAIELNHNIELEYPAYITFRNGCTSQIMSTRRNKIIVNPPPKEAVGAGQSVNIIAKSIDIEGYLTDKDKELLSLMPTYGFNSVMASFVEDKQDLLDIYELLPGAEVIAKIESLKGMKFINQQRNLSLMAARDDLCIELRDTNLLASLKNIIECDPNAICASRIFSSLSNNKRPSLADYCDIELMRLMGYHRFMLDDVVSNYHFDEAITGWQKVKK
jgi:pyruvate kinase